MNQISFNQTNQKAQIVFHYNQENCIQMQTNSDRFFYKNKFILQKDSFLQNIK